jgi:protein TonB
LLGLCLAASLALHVLTFLLLPARQPDAVIVPVPVLDVTMASREPDASPVHARQLVPEVAKRLAALPQPAAPEVTLLSAPGPTVLTPSAPDLIVAVEPLRATDETQAPSRADPPSVPPAFSAAYLRNPAPVYPAIARRSGDQGTVKLKVLVSSEGAPLRVELDQSSGSKSLDGAALDAVRGWRFVPARRGAQNIEGWVRVPVVFKLES